MTVTITLDLPDDIAARLAAASADKLARFNQFAVARLPELLADDTWEIVDPAVDPAAYEHSGEPLDEDYIAELRAIDEENKRGVSISLEELVQRMEADSGPGFVERIRARLAAEGVDIAKTIGAAPGAAV